MALIAMQVITDPKGIEKIFKAIIQDDIPTILQFIRNQNIEIWKFKESDGFTGISVSLPLIFTFAIALHHATYLSKTLIVNTIIDEMKIRLGNDLNKVLFKFVNKKNIQGNSALHYASFKGNLEIMQTLLENGADAFVINKIGLNVLHMAAQGNQPLSLIYFKEKYHIGIHSLDFRGSTPLHWACFKGSEDAVQFILSWNVNVNFQDNNGLTALHIAVMSDKTRIIKELLQKGADKSIKDITGKTPLDLAKIKNKLSIVEMLKETTRCQLCLLRVPIQKVERNSSNIIYFFLIYFSIGTVAFLELLPLINGILFSLFYILTILIDISFYITLIKSNPGVMRNEENKHILTLIEEKKNIKSYCPTCIVAKTRTSKHCIICEICVEGFDHHCFWVNNCIGKGNLCIFFCFLVVTEINILVNVYVSFMCFFIDEPLNLSDSTFPSFIPCPALYKQVTTLIISILIFTFGIFLFFSVGCIICIQLRNFIYRQNKHQAKNIFENKVDKVNYSTDTNKLFLLNNDTMPQEPLFMDQDKNKNILKNSQQFSIY